MVKFLAFRQIPRPTLSRGRLELTISKEPGEPDRVPSGVPGIHGGPF